MSNYVFGTSLSYRDYLQAKSFENSLKSEISKQTRTIIASNEELQREHISISQATSAGIEQLSFQAQDISEKLDELNATFQWGFSELLMAVGEVNTTLTQLVKIAKTPAQTWAYEQFDIARDAFRKGLYQESLEYLDRAINGYAGNTGYKIEYRFHYFLGAIHLGSFRNNSNEISDIPKAESAFLAAAKYARLDQPPEAGRALFAAGWAAYCQGRISEGIRFTEDSLQLAPDVAEAHFQLAKFLMHQGNPDRALLSLKRAIEFDRLYTIKAAGDDDFRRYEDILQAFLESLRLEAKQVAEQALATATARIKETEERAVENYRLEDYVDLSYVKQTLKEAWSAVQASTFYGCLDAMPLCIQVEERLQKALSNFVELAGADVKQEITKLDSQKSNNLNLLRTRCQQFRWLGIGVCFLLGCMSGSFESWFVYMFWGSCLSIAISWAAGRIITRQIVSQTEREKDRLQSLLPKIQSLPPWAIIQ